MSHVEFYHYTDAPGKDAILRQGIIRQSNGAADALFGPGVYGTSIPPGAGKTMIAWNNWDGLSLPSRSVLAKASWAFKIMLPAALVRLEDTTRDVLRYVGGDIILSHFAHVVIRV